jgi:type II secretory pathway component PulK
VLIMVMVVLTGLALVAFHLAARCRMRLAEVSGTVRAVQGKWLAHAAAQRGTAALEADNNEWDWLNEPWAQLGEIATEKWFSRDIEGLNKDLLASCSVMDEHAKINVRSLEKAAQVAQLGQWGEALTPLLSDWIDENEDRRADGAESADYAEAAGEGYSAKDRPLEVLEELRFLKGLSAQAMLGEDSNGNGVLDPWEDDGPARLPLDNADGLLDRGPWSVLTCAGDGRININTAPLEVLEVLAREDAAAIVAYREDRQKGTSSQPPFKTVQELVDQVGLEQWKVDSLQSSLCTASNDFRIVAIVRDSQGRSVARHEVLVVREEAGCKVRMYGGW